MTQAIMIEPNPCILGSSYDPIQTLHSGPKCYDSTQTLPLSHTIMIRPKP